jgi:drug/metabolite transporter (DMT)-like permease
MSLLTIILTLTPVVTWLWSVVLFGGRPTAIEIAGGVATLAGVLLVTASRAGVLAGGPPARLDRRRGPG